ncbi:MAG: outer membrane beta-barrel protein [Zoogloeaceae bacterium]|jgi:opacity protein-like surface antigen|nr:outer membrane beta-barrel protein [Zoogloeaceae bacterium]
MLAAALAASALPTSADSLSPYVAVRLGHTQTKWDAHAASRDPAAWSAVIANPVHSDKFSAKDGNIFGALAVGASLANLCPCAPNWNTPLGKASDTEQRQVHVDLVGGGAQNVDAYSKQRLKGQTLFTNIRWDFRNSSPVTPYPSAGIGVAFLKLKVDLLLANSPSDFYTGSESHSKTNFAWNIGAGVGWQLSKQLTLDAGYCYADLGKVSSGDHQMISSYGVSVVPTARQKADDIHQHQLSIGLLFLLNAAPQRKTRPVCTVS